ncbi:MAG: DNA methyltransferase, partial [bacterium]
RCDLEGGAPRRQAGVVIKAGSRRGRSSLAVDLVSVGALDCLPGFWHFGQYPLVAREIWDLLSRPAVAGGALERAIEALPRKPAAKGKARQQWLFKPDRSRALDTDFLNFLDAARRDLASDLIRHNDRADLLEDNRLNEAVQRILDPACGSGSFLIRAFERVCEHWQTALTKNERKRRREECWTDPVTGDVHLTTDLKRRILTANIFGVDLDAGAVEVTQLSLYLKMLEGENRTTLAAERDLFGSDIALLPPLQDNIKCGNSLIASDFSIIPEDLVRVRAFDWDVQFAAIMKNGGFDAVVGNPPYIRIQGFPQDQVGYFVRVFGAATGNYDVYVNFVERGFNLLGPKGRLGMILPNKFFRTDYGLGLRRCLSTVTAVTKIVDFGVEQVFEATTYTCLQFLSRESNGTFQLARSATTATSLDEVCFECRSSETLRETPWTFSAERESQLLEKINSVSVRLLDLPADMSRGSCTSGDDQSFLIEAGVRSWFVELEPLILAPSAGKQLLPRWMDYMHKAILWRTADCPT